MKRDSTAWLDGLVCLGVLAVFSTAHSALGATGGPDGYGYHWDDGIPYSYTPVYPGGNCGRGDDTYWSENVGFPFEFYGGQYSYVYVHSNGYISFVYNEIYAYNYTMPYNYHLMIAPLWDDLRSDNTGWVCVETIGTAPNRVFIAEWWENEHFVYQGQQATDTVTFQIKLFEADGSIEFHYEDVDFDDSDFDEGASATVGIQDGSQGYGLQYSYNSPALSDSMAIRFALDTCNDADGDGHESLACGGLDCDDTDGSIYPGANEVCNGYDDDCDGVVDEGLALNNYYIDQDGDGYGDSSYPPQTTCAPPAGYVANGSDCDDTDDDVHPGAPEICNNADDDCDGNTDEGVQNYDYYPDADGDGHGDASQPTVEDCMPPAGYTLSDDDCDDSDPNIYPGAPEVACNGEDDDCDGYQHGDDIDDDGDGASECEGDCDDADPDLYAHDVDGDGDSTCDGDCDDADPTSYDGAPELCDGVDNDCNNVVPADEDDADGDGFRLCDGDCDDTNADAYPDGPELCDGVDNDCDGVADESVDEDLDGDGHSPCDGDCDDTDADISPEAVELCDDGVDNNCDGVVDEDDPDCVGDDDDSGDDDDNGGDDDDGSMIKASGDCECNAGGSATTGPVGALLLLGVLLGRRRLGRA